GRSAQLGRQPLGQEPVGIKTSCLQPPLDGTRNRHADIWRAATAAVNGPHAGETLIFFSGFTRSLARPCGEPSQIFTAFTPQMSLAYSRMVRSLENFPTRAVFMIAIRAQRRLSR